MYIYFILFLFLKETNENSYKTKMSYKKHVPVHFYVNRIKQKASINAITYDIIKYIIIDNILSFNYNIMASLNYIIIHVSL